MSNMLYRDILGLGGKKKKSGRGRAEIRRTNLKPWSLQAYILEMVVSHMSHDLGGF